MLEAKQVDVTEKAIKIEPINFQYQGDLFIPKSEVGSDGIVSDWFCKKYRGLTGTLHIALDEAGSEGDDEIAASIGSIDANWIGLAKRSVVESTPQSEGAEGSELLDRLEQLNSVLGVCIHRAMETTVKTTFADLSLSGEKRADMAQDIGTTVFIQLARERAI